MKFWFISLLPTPEHKTYEPNGWGWSGCMVVGPEWYEYHSNLELNQNDQARQWHHHTGNVYKRMFVVKAPFKTMHYRLRATRGVPLIFASHFICGQIFQIEISILTLILTLFAYLSVSKDGGRGGRWTSLDASFARCFAIFWNIVKTSHR